MKASADSITVIGIDLGGTRIKGVLLQIATNASGWNETILEELVLPTSDDSTGGWRAVVKEVADSLAAKAAVPVTVGLAAPGLPNATNTAIAFMPGRLSGLENFDWSAYLGRPAWVLNDAVAALMAEARLGAAKGYQHVALLTLGTGVGGALLINGKPYQGSFQKAGHIGHMVINDQGEPDVTGMPGSLEDAIGNVTIGRRTSGRFQNTSDLLKAAADGDEYAQEVWLLSVRRLAIGIASVTNILSPELVILGGGITEAGDRLFHPLEEFMALYEWRAGGHRAAIRKARFADRAGAVGAACFAADRLIENQSA